MSRPTIDDLKERRDGHLAYGPHLSIWERSPWPKTTSIGYDAGGEPVAECRSFGPGSGEVMYGNHEAVVRWDRTEAGEALRRESTDDGR